MMVDEIKLAIFDHSGTLSDDLDMVVAATNYIRAQHNIEPTDRAGIRRDMQADVAKYYLKLGISSTRKELSKMYDQAFGEIDERPKAIPGVQEVVYKLSTIVPVAIFSSHPQELIERELMEYGFFHCVNRIQGWVNKKDVEALQGLCDKFEIHPRNTLYIGDTAFDVHLGNNAGCQTVGVYDQQYSYHTRKQIEEANPAFSVKHIKEILSEFNNNQ